MANNCLECTEPIVPGQVAREGVHFPQCPVADLEDAREVMRRWSAGQTVAEARLYRASKMIIDWLNDEPVRSI